MAKQKAIPRSESHANQAHAGPWTLVTTLLWIATRDEQLSLANATQSLNRADIHLAVRRARKSQKTGQNLLGMWKSDLAPALASRKLSGFATYVHGAPLVRGVPGKQFPPKKQPGLVFVLEPKMDSYPAVLVGPNSKDQPLHNYEFHDITFSSEDVLKLWPSHTPEIQPLPLNQGHQRGRRPEKLLKTIAAMKEDLAKGRLTREELNGLLEKQLEDRYGVSRDTGRRARNALLEVNSDKLAQTTNSDK